MPLDIDAANLSNAASLMALEVFSAAKLEMALAKVMLQVKLSYATTLTSKGYLNIVNYI